ncbi:MAG: OmpA family protein [Crocinitomicaceae bacterium]|nr:OmpA family protein [Crocinitomicaceae bacterium]
MSQSLDEAIRYFERFEYALSAEIYSEYAKVSPLSLEDYKRFGYAYFVIGEYEKCLPISDSILKTRDVEPFWYYVNGEVNMGERNYERAKESYEKYQSLDDEYDVALNIQSCGLIPNWEAETYLINKHLGFNSSKADITGPNFKDRFIRYSEIGKDSIGEHMNDGSIDESELILARPIIGSRGVFKRVLIVDTVSNLSISSLSFFPNGQDVLLTINKPMANEEIDLVPHIYKGVYNSASNQITNIERWEYSGYEDTTSCAHASINASGNLIIFTKMGKKTNGADLYKTELSNGSWSIPTAISILNTNYDEMYPVFMGDTLLSIASDGRPGYGGLDMYLSEVTGSSFASPSHLKAPVNSFKDDFNFCYYNIDSARYTSNRIGGKGDDDMYFVKFSEPFIAPLADSTDFKNFVKNWKTPIVYFDFDHFDINQDIENISGLIGFLKTNTNSYIEIEGHTDRRGNVDYNYNLGYKRAQTVKSELIKKGIREGQIKVSSKGETDPQFHCSTGCNDAQHGKNRVALVKLNAL